MSDSAVDVPISTATGWPTVADLAMYTGVPVTDVMLQVALDASINYGELTLGDRYVGPVGDAIKHACMDYAASVYTIRIGQADVAAEQFFGSTPLTRYRRILLASRFTAIA